MTNQSQEQSIELLANLVLTASGERTPTFEVIAYAGGLFTPSINGRPARAVVDLAGLDTSRQRIPVLKDHNGADEVAHTEAIVNDGRQLVASGIVSGAGEPAKRVVEAGKKGFPWQASIGLAFSMQDTRLVADGQSVSVNGRTLTGPFLLILKSSLREISAVSLGADADTSLKVAASAAKDSSMDQTDPNVEATTASAEAATAIDSPKVEPKPETLTASAGNGVDADIQQIRASRAAEAKRISQIEKLCAKHGDIGSQAIAEGWTPEKAELAVLRASLPKAPAAIVRETMSTSDVLTAGLCLATKLPAIEKHFDEKTLNAADRQFKGGATFSIQRMLLEAAQANGYVGNYFDKTISGLSDTLRAAFSTRNISGVLSNTANKFVMSAYGKVEQAWRKIATTRPVNDFKTITSYRLLDASTYEELSPEGRIAHGTLDEQSYTNQAKTYAKMYGLTRADLINDDAGALATMSSRLGRGAGLKLNNVFWTLWKADTSFFSNSNTPDNLAASALGIDGLTTVVAQYDGFTDPEGNPLAAEGKILLVPPQLEALANQLMTSQAVNNGSTSNTPQDNPHRGKYEVVKSRYLTDADAWYLLADPMDIAGIEVVFLNGVETPTVEQADADFDQLGIQMRGYFDFGVAFVDKRCGVKSNAS